jgi:hypothetical protein
MQKYTILTLLLVTFGACMHAANLTHRYAFTSDADDSILIDSLDGTLSTDNSPTNTLEAPQFTTDIPAGAHTSFATNSIEFGMSIGDKASSVNFGRGTQTDIFDGKAGSFSYWFKADQLLNSSDLVSNISGSEGLRTLLLTDGHIRLTGAGMDNNNVQFKTTSAVTVNTWHHLVVEWDDPNGVLKIALDGSTQTQAFSAGALEDPSRLIAGNFSDNDSKLHTQFDGKLFDLQMYQGMLSEADITSLYENPGSSLSDLSIPEPRHYSLLISLLVLGHLQARRRGPAN